MGSPPNVAAKLSKELFIMRPDMKNLQRLALALTLAGTAVPVSAAVSYSVLSAFYGLDNGKPQTGESRQPDWFSSDGMPVVFSHEIDAQSINIDDFLVYPSAGGLPRKPVVATLRPADESGEQRTILLLGEFGSYPGNEPARVVISGRLLSKDGRHNYKGSSVTVTPLMSGPFVDLAEWFSYSDPGYPYLSESSGNPVPGADGPAAAKTVVRLVWSGGVRSAAGGGGELSNAELANFEATFDINGKPVVVKPFAFGDLNDNDNNLDLCFDVAGTPVSVRVMPATVVDPNNDANLFVEFKRIERRTNW